MSAIEDQKEPEQQLIEVRRFYPIVNTYKIPITIGEHSECSCHQLGHQAARGLPILLRECIKTLTQQLRALDGIRRAIYPSYVGRDKADFIRIAASIVMDYYQYAEKYNLYNCDGNPRLYGDCLEIRPAIVNVLQKNLK